MEHVSIYKKPNSPFWYIASFDAVKNKRVWKSSKIRIDDPLGRRKVLAMARDRSEDAKANKPILNRSAWEHWAENYFHMRYGKHEKTLQRALGAFKVLREWLDEAGLPTPAQIEYKHAHDWIRWRTSQKRPNGNQITRNTALCDLKFLNLLLREAVRRGFCAGVPTERLGLKKDPQKEKPEITDAQDQLVRKALKKEPEWMRLSYEIAMAQGCRLTETQVPLTDVREDLGVITFDAKGDKQFATRLNPSLIPLIKARRVAGSARLVELPRMASKEWCFFFDRIGMPEHSFHCTRVTVVTRMARAGVPIQQAMAFVGHASELIHRIYQRLAPQDLALAVAALSAHPSNALPGTTGSPSPKPRKRPAS